MEFSHFLFYMVCCHFLADYPLQGDFLAQAKNRNTELGKLFWPHALTAHSMIHAGFVAAVTGNIWLGLAEAVAHGITDYLKCEQKISLHIDQAIHIGCKVLWAYIAISI